MSPSDLRTRISDEICDLEPMPTVVGEVLVEGARRERRRRRVGVGVAAAATGLIVLGAAGVPRLLDAAPTPAQPAPADRSTVGTHTQTKEGFDRWAAAKFDAALPERFAEVRPTSMHSFVTEVDGRRVTFNINITQTDWEHSDVDPGELDLTPSCADVAPADCAALPGQNAIAYHETNPGVGAYAGMEMYLGERSSNADEVALNFFGRAAEGPLPLSNREILTLAESPEFEQIWREYVAHPSWVYPSTIVMMDPRDKRKDVFGPVDPPRSRR